MYRTTTFLLGCALISVAYLCILQEMMNKADINTSSTIADLMSAASSSYAPSSSQSTLVSVRPSSSSPLLLSTLSSSSPLSTSSSPTSSSSLTSASSLSSSTPSLLTSTLLSSTSISSSLPLSTLQSTSLSSSSVSSSLCHSTSAATSSSTFSSTSSSFLSTSLSLPTSSSKSTSAQAAATSSSTFSSTSSSFLSTSLSLSTSSAKSTSAQAAQTSTATLLSSTPNAYSTANPTTTVTFPMTTLATTDVITSTTVSPTVVTNTTTALPSTLSTTTPCAPQSTVPYNYTLSNSACKSTDDQISFQFNESYFDSSCGIAIISYNIIFAPTENLTSPPELLFSEATTWDKSNDWQLPFFVTTNDTTWNPFDKTINKTLNCCTMDSANSCNSSTSDSIDIIVGSSQCAKGDFCSGPLPSSTNFTIVIRANTGSSEDENCQPAYLVATVIATPFFPPLEKTLSAGAIAGIVIGVLVFVGLLIFLAYFTFTYYEAKKKQKIKDTNIEVSNFLNKLKYFADRSWIDLIMEFENIDKSVIHDQNVALAEANMSRNRYTNILPYDYNRVILMDQECDYINASYIDGFNRTKEYIATQGPMDEEDVNLRSKKHTVADFWAMIWQQHVKCIIMLTSLQESGRTKSACYWPSLNESRTWDSTKVKLLEETDNGHFVVRKIHLRQKKENRFVIHHQYVNWSDMKATDEENLLHFLKTVRTSGDMNKNPVVIHCSAGVGRTGTFIALDILLQQLEHGTRTINIFNCSSKLRQQRILMGQVDKQYILIYKCIGRAIEEMTVKEMLPRPSDENIAQTSYDNENFINSSVNDDIETQDSG